MHHRCEGATEPRGLRLIMISATPCNVLLVKSNVDLFIICCLRYVYSKKLIQPMDLLSSIIVRLLPEDVVNFNFFK